MRCPLGCREHHRAMTSRRRSGDYYQSDEGKRKKRGHNAARLHNDDSQLVTTGEADPAVEGLSPEAEESHFKESVVQYTRMVMSRTEGRKVSRDEALATLRRVVRQRSLDSP